MARTARSGRKRFRRRGRADEAGFEDSSPRDLTDVVGEHLIPTEQQGVTAHWSPSRRGNSPHHRT